MQLLPPLRDVKPRHKDTTQLGGSNVRFEQKCHQSLCYLVLPLGGKMGCLYKWQAVYSSAAASAILRVGSKEKKSLGEKAAPKLGY